MFKHLLLLFIFIFSINLNAQSLEGKSPKVDETLLNKIKKRYEFYPKASKPFLEEVFKRDIPEHEVIDFLNNLYRIWEVARSEIKKPSDSQYFNAIQNYKGAYGIYSFQNSIEEEFDTFLIKVSYMIYSLKYSDQEDHYSNSNMHLRASWLKDFLPARTRYLKEWTQVFSSGWESIFIIKD